MRSTYYAWCAASGLAWGVLAYFLSRHWMHRYVVLGGVVAAPLIGVVVGAAYRRAYSLSRWKQFGISLVTLYLGASLFAIAGGMLDLVLRGRMEHYIVQADGSRAFGYRILSSAITTPLLGTLWGLTFGGYAVVLWPLAFANHRLLRSQGQRPSPPLQQTGRP